LTPDRFIRVALTAMNKTPKLAQCDQASLFGALMTCSQLGIEPDGRRAHLIPYGTVCQLIIDYKGLAELAMRSGMISNLHADVVCDADEFEYNMGEVTKHRIDFRKPRGAVYAAYAVATFRDGTKKAEAMSRDEIEMVRAKSRAGNSGPWADPQSYPEMCKKTVFRRLSKWLPLSPEYRDALDADADDIAAPYMADVVDVTPEKPAKKKGMDALAAKMVKVEDVEPVEVQEQPQVDPRVSALVKKIDEARKYKSVSFKKAIDAHGLTADDWSLASAETLEQVAAAME
jgi:recombination protein RecT